MSSFSLPSSNTNTNVIDFEAPAETGYKQTDKYPFSSVFYVSSRPYSDTAVLNA